MDANKNLKKFKKKEKLFLYIIYNSFNINLVKFVRKKLKILII